ncbi:hypothetical protein NJBCHELONAE_43530 [Mycobacteroides chelonae]|uniref:EsaB/YukD family protein n=1 Tax=Mycobacteroides chelonae TaxID=1774 RepID=UPI0021DE4A25|nr:EsaB/YukD family protein [Mycobacteroides chelonae]GLE59042.1 hypothetical protein NJBCHELONAE_43530 [Mycobacteroides chelonae]
MSPDTVTGVSLAIGKSTQVDLELSNNKPLSKVLGDLQDYLGDYLDAVGSVDELPPTERGWRLRTPLGTLLDQKESLAAQNIKTGRSLELIEAPRGEQFVARIESVSTLLSRLGARLYAAATPDSVAPVLAVGAGSMLGAALLILEVMAFRAPTLLHVGLALGACALIAVLALVNARTLKSRVVADMCLAGLLGFTPASVSLLVTLLQPGPWGGPHLMAAAWTVVVLAVIGLGSGRYVVGYTAVTVSALFVALTYTGIMIAALFSTNPGTSAAGTLIPTQTVSAVVLWFVIWVLLSAEIIAPRIARLPNATFPSGSGRFIGRRGAQQREAIEARAAAPDPADMFGRSVRANQTLTGILVGLALPASAVAAILIYEHPTSWLWQLVAAAIPAVFAYRTWHYGGLKNVAALLLGTFMSAFALVASVAAVRGLWWGLGLALVVALLALLAPLSIPTSEREQPPTVRMARMASEFVVIGWALGAPYLLLRIVPKVYNRDFS